MRRIILVLTVAALMALMMASAGPAKAQSNTGDFTTQQGLVSVGDDWWWSDDDDDWWWWSDDGDDDDWGWGSGGNGISFNMGDSENVSGGVSFSS
jgi:hypothetical protein